MSNAKWLLTIKTNGVVKQCFARGTKKNFKYIEDRNVSCEVLVENNSLIIKKSGKVSFVCRHQKSILSEVKCIINEGNKQFELDNLIYTNELIVSKDKIYVSFKNNEDTSIIEYNLKECYEF